MAFPPRMIDRLLWPLGLAHGSSFVYFSPSLTRFPLAKRSTRDTYYLSAMPAIPLLTQHLHHSIILIISHQWRQCPHRHMTWVHVAEPISNWEPCPNCPNCPSAFTLSSGKMG